MHFSLRLLLYLWRETKFLTRCHRRRLSTIFPITELPCQSFSWGVVMGGVWGEDWYLFTAPKLGRCMLGRCREVINQRRRKTVSVGDILWAGATTSPVHLRTDQPYPSSLPFLIGYPDTFTSLFRVRKLWHCSKEIDTFGMHLLKMRWYDL